MREEDRDAIDPAAVSARRSRWIAAVLVIAGVALFLGFVFWRSLYLYLAVNDGP